MKASPHNADMETIDTPLDAALIDQCDAYDRMARALTFLGDNWREWPSLGEVAAHVGLSPSHFQREFTKWSGVSPKQFMSAYAHVEAGAALRAGESVLDASLDVGLSGPGRLHDLFIAHEALTPGEVKSKGRGVDLTIGRAPTPFGIGVYLISPKGLCALGFIDETPEERVGTAKVGRREDEAFADLAGRYPNASISRDDREAEIWAERVFISKEPTPLVLYGTPFRRQVWRALLDIPLGETWTYGQLSRYIDAPKANRATGAAVGANPLSWLIPCHRALAADGRLHNYHWGVKRKRAMLVMERAQSVAL